MEEAQIAKIKSRWMCGLVGLIIILVAPFLSPLFWIILLSTLFVMSYIEPLTLIIFTLLFGSPVALIGFIYIFLLIFISKYKIFKLNYINWMIMGGVFGFMLIVVYFIYIYFHNGRIDGLNANYLFKLLSLGPIPGAIAAPFMKYLLLKTRAVVFLPEPSPEPNAEKN